MSSYSQFQEKVIDLIQGAGPGGISHMEYRELQLMYQDLGGYLERMRAAEGLANRYPEVHPLFQALNQNLAYDQFQRLVI